MSFAYEKILNSQCKNQIRSLEKEEISESRKSLDAMNSVYLTDEEYRTYWFSLEGLRKNVSESLGLRAGMMILDVGSGWGLFAIEMAKQLKRGEVVGIDIAGNDMINARKLIKEAEVQDIVSIQEMDATELSFPDNHFNLATSFLGMRDIHMTKGKIGVKKAVEEMIRVVKPKGKIVLCVTPLEDMKTEDQRIAVKLEGKIFGAESMPKKFYLNIFRENNVKLIETRSYSTGKKLTANQAMAELKEGIEIARRIYGKRVAEFREVWEEYGRAIEVFGYGMYSNIVMLIAQKVN